MLALVVYLLLQSHFSLTQSSENRQLQSLVERDCLIARHCASVHVLPVCWQSE